MRFCITFVNFNLAALVKLYFFKADKYLYLQRPTKFLVGLVFFAIELALHAVTVHV